MEFSMPLRSYILNKAERLLRHPEDLISILRDGMRKAYQKRTILIQVWEDFLSLFRLVKCSVSGEYKEAPRKVILWAVVAILYFVSPLDIIPDIFPGGYLDDIYVIQLILRKFQVDIKKFRDWEALKLSKQSPVKS